MGPYPAPGGTVFTRNLMEERSRRYENHAMDVDGGRRLVGLLLSALLVLHRGGERIGEWHSAPWYMLVSGFLGVALFLTINVTLPRLGAAAMIALIIVGQLLTGVFIDTQGWLGVPVRPLDLYRSAGILLLLAGGWLLVK